ncbi:hypothetical protein CRUP_036043 [Coryphaenoides rupestris]|nr:hypothetical protein CRUP_036043 [Coryphaenoides rupestris]
MTRIHDVSEREYHGCLQLDSPTHLNNGQYTLLATNRYGTDRKDVDAHFMKEPWEGTVTDPQYYGTLSTNNDNDDDSSSSS